MSKIVVIGGTGHVGTYLIPSLVASGHEVVVLTRGTAQPYLPHPAWNAVTRLMVDREAQEAAGTFGQTVAALNADVVIDMICFTESSARHLAEALVGKVGHLVHVGTIWVHGPATTQPCTEADAKFPFGDYGVQKSAIEDMLLTMSRRGTLPATVVRPGHIVGPGWAPLNPAGHFNPQVFRDIRDGNRLILPNFGLETVHHVHAEDVAQVIALSAANWSTSAGEAFNAVSPAALTLRGYAEAMFRWFGRDPQIDFLPYAEWAKTVAPSDATATWEHIARSPCHSIAKAQRLLGYAPRWTSLAAVQDSVTTLLADK